MTTAIALEVFERASRPSPITITSEWFVGFCDGECSLNIAGHGGSLQPRFRLNQRDDDGDLVRAIRAYLGVGSLHAKHDRYNPNAHPQCALAVIGKDCLRLVEIFEKYPLNSKKRLEYPFWRSAVSLYFNMPGSRWGPSGENAARNDALWELQQEIIHVRRYGGPR